MTNMMGASAKLEEMRGWLKHAEPQVKKYGGFVEMKDELLMEPEKAEEPKTVKYGDELMILLSSSRETVEEAEEVLVRRMRWIACKVGMPECVDTIRTFVHSGTNALGGMLDPLFGTIDTAYVTIRMDVPKDVYDAYIRAQEGEDDE